MNEMAFRVTSNDGTTIAYDRKGKRSGRRPGRRRTGRRSRAAHDTCSRRALHGLQLCPSGTRRERLHRAHAVEREIEDLDALIAEAGGSAHLFGASSNSALALEAVPTAGSAIDTIAVWEVPYVVGDDIRPRFEEYVADTQHAFDAGQGEVLELFMRMTGASDDNIAAEAASSRRRIGRVRSPSRPRWSTTSSSTATSCRPIDWQPGHPTGPGHHRRTDHGPYMAGLPSDFFDRAADGLADDAPRSTGDPRGAGSRRRPTDRRPAVAAVLQQRTH